MFSWKCFDRYTVLPTQPHPFCVTLSGKSRSMVADGVSQLGLLFFFVTAITVAMPPTDDHFASALCGATGSGSSHTMWTAEDCPLPCRCSPSDPQSLRCDALNLSSLPLTVWDSLPTSLNLTSNQLEVWPPPLSGFDGDFDEPDMVSGSCIRKLLVANNRITRIEPATLMRMPDLRHLEFSDNSITSLSTETFSGLRHLEFLDLSRNHISYLGEHVFRDLTQLKVLILASNHLGTLQPKTFRTLFQLRSLNISDNPLLLLQGDLLAALHHLADFSAAGTQLRQLSVGLFHHTSSLTAIDLSRCNQLEPLSAVMTSLLPANLTVLKLGSRIACDCSREEFQTLVAELLKRQPPVQLYCDEQEVTSFDTYCSTTPLDHRVILVTVSTTGSREPLPYDPMLGWYTAAVLSGLLFTFIGCVWLEKAEKKLVEACLNNRQKRKERANAAVSAQAQQQTLPVCTFVDGTPPTADVMVVLRQPLTGSSPGGKSESTESGKLLAGRPDTDSRPVTVIAVDSKSVET